MEREAHPTGTAPAPPSAPVSGDDAGAGPTAGSPAPTGTMGGAEAPGDRKPSEATSRDASRLRLYQLVSPALPVGAFSYSEGLEVLVQSGRLADAGAVATWLEAELRRGALRLEAAALPGLMDLLRAWRRRSDDGDGAGATETRRQLRDRDGWLLAQREAAELRAQQRQMGGSLLQLLADLGWPLPEPLPLAWPAAFAWGGVCLQVSDAALVEAYVYGWVANQLSAAVRLVPLGPTEAQRLQLRLSETIATEAAALAATDPETLWNGGVGAGLAQLGHSGLYSRLFRS